MAELPRAWQDVVDAVRNNNKNRDNNMDNDNNDEHVSSSSLRGDVAALMSALRSHDSDTWPGQPACIDLGVRFPWQHAADNNNNSDNSDDAGARASLDALMSEYVECVAQLRAHDSDATAATTKTTTRSTVDADMTALLQQLDTLPALP